MVSELIKCIIITKEEYVLILVVVEDGLGDGNNAGNNNAGNVLILVVVEDGLGDIWYK